MFTKKFYIEFYTCLTPVHAAGNMSQDWDLDLFAEKRERKMGDGGGTNYSTKFKSVTYL